jgi:hypothetical protein
MAYTAVDRGRDIVKVGGAGTAVGVERGVILAQAHFFAALHD